MRPPSASPLAPWHPHTKHLSHPTLTLYSLASRDPRATLLDAHWPERTNDFPNPAKTQQRKWQFRSLAIAAREWVWLTLFFFCLFLFPFGPPRVCPGVATALAQTVAKQRIFSSPGKKGKTPRTVGPPAEIQKVDRSPPFLLLLSSPPARRRCSLFERFVRPGPVHDAKSALPPPLLRAVPQLACEPPGNPPGKPVASCLCLVARGSDTTSQRCQPSLVRSALSTPSSRL